MRKDKKPLGRWIGEALLIFLSVFGAFYFENYREERNQERIYIRHLNDFKEDLKDNQGKFNYELNQEYVKSNGQGYINGTIDELEFFDSLLSVPTQSNADTLLKMIENRTIIGLTKWIFISPQYEALSNQFYSFIKNDTLKSLLEMHYRNNESRINLKNDINRYADDFHRIEDQLNWSAGPTQANREILFSNIAVNTIRRLTRSYYGLLNSTRGTKSSDSLLLVQVKRELNLWGESN